MKKLAALLLTLALCAPTLTADETKDNTKAEDRIKAAGTVLDEIESAPDTGIPEDLLKSAECVAVVPSLLKGGFIVAASIMRWNSGRRSSVADCPGSTNSAAISQPRLLP